MENNKEIYTPMEAILIKGAQALTTKEIVGAALKTKEDFNTALLLDNMLLELEAQADMMDGKKMEEWIL